MIKNKILPDDEFRRRWSELAFLAHELVGVFSREQLAELCNYLEMWIDWDAGEEYQFDEDAPDGAEILTALLSQALTYASRQPLQETVVP